MLDNRFPNPYTSLVLLPSKCPISSDVHLLLSSSSTVEAEIAAVESVDSGGVGCWLCGGVGIDCRFCGGVGEGGLDLASNDSSLEFINVIKLSS